MQPQAEISFFSPAKLCIQLNPKACLFWKPWSAEKCLAKIQGTNKSRWAEQAVSLDREM